jgi:CubicO group peptidase (beta-lactamase class C family)
MLVGVRHVRLPAAMASFPADGGIGSTAQEALTFLRAFMTGELFDAARLPAMRARWNRIFPPMQYGVGIMRFKLPRIYSPVRPMPEPIGHSGASGAVLHYAPEHDLYIAGTVNQIKKRGLPYRVMSELIAAMRR